MKTTPAFRFEYADGIKLHHGWIIPIGKTATVTLDVVLPDGNVTQISGMYAPGCKASRKELMEGLEKQFERGWLYELYLVALNASRR